MDIIKNSKIGESMCIKRLPSGLTCYIFPRKYFVEKQAMLAVNFGSADIDFSINGNKVHVPEGIAHFLEHKTFEDESLDYFDEFSKLGGHVNAFTNFNITAYYYSCNENFSKCLDLLFDMVYKPYFTDENVQKEKGIIEQEISMYDDDPSWKVYFNMLQGLYNKAPVKYEIAGTAKSIQAIDKDMLYKCYDTFYTPANMTFICTGDFSPEEIFELLQAKDLKANGNTIDKLYEREQEKAAAKRAESAMSVSKPLFCLGFKDDNTQRKAESLAATKILLDILLGQSSKLYNKLYLSGVLDNGFYMDYSNGNCYSSTMFSGSSYDVDAAVSAIWGGIKELKQKGIDSETFERIKNKHIGRYIRSFNGVGSVCGMQAEFYSKGFTVFDLMDVFMAMDKNTVAERLEMFKDDNCCLSVVKPL